MRLNTTGGGRAFQRKAHFRKSQFCVIHLIHFSFVYTRFLNFLECHRLLSQSMLCLRRGPCGCFRSKCCTGSMGVRRNFSRGSGKTTFRLSFSGCWRCKHKWTYTKKKMSNVTETVAYNVFLGRKHYSEQMLVLVSMDF